MKKILLLDDDKDVVEVVEEVLLYENFEVKSIISGETFISVVEDYRPDLIILDYLLGDADGGDICRQIKCHPLLKGTPTIIFPHIRVRDWILTNLAAMDLLPSRSTWKNCCKP